MYLLSFLCIFNFNFGIIIKINTIIIILIISINKKKNIINYFTLSIYKKKTI